jgi:hypothetical protein
MMKASYEDRWLESFRANDAFGLREALRGALKEGGYDCFLHPLGFFFSRLAVRDTTSIRLHYWPANYRRLGTAVTPYHDHVWRLRSCILVGTLDNVLIDVEEDQRGIFQLAEITQSGAVDDVRPGDQSATIRIRSRSTYVAGDIYDIEPRVFHFTDVPPAQPTVTLVRAEITVSGGPRTLVPVGFGGHAPERKPLASTPEILDEIANLLEK